MTTYNILQASWAPGREILSDIPRDLLEELEPRLTRHTGRGGIDLYSFEFTQSGRPLVGLVLSLCEPLDPDSPGEPYIHAVVTDAGHARALPETALLQLFESIYGAPLGERVRAATRAFAGWSLPHDGPQAHRYFISEEALRNFLSDRQLDSDPDSAVPLSSLLTQRIVKPAAEVSPNPFLPPGGPLPSQQPSKPQAQTPSTKKNATFETPPLLLPDPPSPNSNAHPQRVPNSHELSWRIFRASALFTAGALIGILLAPRWLTHNVKTTVSHAPVVPPHGVIEPKLAREHLATHAKMLARYREQFDEQERAFIKNTSEKPASTDPPTAATRAVPFPPAGSGEPLTTFQVMIRDSVYLRAVPLVEDNKPLRILQDGEVFAVSRELSREDGMWYELRYGWVKATPRVLRISEGTTAAPNHNEPTEKEPLLSPESELR